MNYSKERRDAAARVKEIAGCCPVLNVTGGSKSAIERSLVMIARSVASLSNASIGSLCEYY